jgi:ubiquitin-activating enzyme E1-like protein
VQPLEQVLISGSASGLRLNQKPFMIPDDAFSVLENAYVWRDQVKKREGLELLGRLQRQFTDQPLGNTDGAGNFSGDLTVIFSLESTAEIAPGSITVTIGAQIFTEGSNGNLTNGAAGTGTINYLTGAITINTDPNLAATAITITFGYYPCLPVMGIWQREIAGINDEQTVFFDTKYAYTNPNGLENGFQEFASTLPVTWDGDDINFFLATNYRGVAEYDRLFFVTNFNNTAGSPMRYHDGTTWSAAWTPIVSVSGITTFYMFQARILIPYYGRLLAFNTYEGTSIGTSHNYFNRCRFSQIGDPTAADAWRHDEFGKGGFIDAPVNEEIVSAIFFKNTLVVGFERSTWQLRYVGEYGLPFIWERISSDFGCESTFSPVLFDQGVLQVGDRAIVSCSSNTVDRIDLQIPDIVFQFRNDEFGKSRVWSARNFQKEIVYWSWVNTNLESASTWKYPNQTLLFNYRNNTYAIFRDNVTAFGIYQPPTGVTWDRTDKKWDDFDVFWDNEDANPEFESIVSGNQQGFIHYYASSSIDEPSLYISAFTAGTNTIELTVPDHNLANEEWIQITNAVFSTGDPGFNNRIYQIATVDKDTIAIYFWQNGDVPVTLDPSNYVGGGLITLFPVMDIQTKDFNPYQAKGSQLKLSYIDLLVDAFPQGLVSINVITNASNNNRSNIIVGNNKVEDGLYLFGAISNISQSNPAVITSANHGLRTNNSVTITNVVGMTQINNITALVTYINANQFSLQGVDSSAFSAYITSGNWQSNTQNLYIPGSNYAWHRFFATCTGQFLRIQITYNDEQMADIVNSYTNFILNSIALWVRPGSRSILP